MYIHFALPMSSLVEITMMITPSHRLMLYASFDDFLKNFYEPAWWHLWKVYNCIPVEASHFSAIRRSRDGVLFHVWARVQAGYFPAVEVGFIELEERDRALHREEPCHRAG